MNHPTPPIAPAKRRITNQSVNRLRGWGVELSPDPLLPGPSPSPPLPEPCASSSPEASWPVPEPPSSRGAEGPASWPASSREAVCGWLALSPVELSEELLPLTPLSGGEAWSGPEGVAPCFEALEVGSRPGSNGPLWDGSPESPAASLLLSVLWLGSSGRFPSCGRFESLMFVYS